MKDGAGAPMPLEREWRRAATGPRYARGVRRSAAAGRQEEGNNFYSRAKDNLDGDTGLPGRLPQEAVEAGDEHSRACGSEASSSPGDVNSLACRIWRTGTREEGIACEKGRALREEESGNGPTPPGWNRGGGSGLRSRTSEGAGSKAPASGRELGERSGSATSADVGPKRRRGWRGGGPSVTIAPRGWSPAGRQGRE
jgi:hypothetical protein